jgi:hypothetical protein
VRKRRTRVDGVGHKTPSFTHGQHGATAAELQARAGHASQAAMAIYQHATLDRDRSLAEKIGATYEAWRESRT